MREQRAVNLLSKRFRSQLWMAMDGAEWPSVSLYSDDVVYWTVDLSKKYKPIKTALLIEFNAANQSLDGDWNEDLRRIRDLAARVRFMWATSPQVISARVVDTVPWIDGRMRARVTHPAAMGSAMGFPRKRHSIQPVFSDRVLTGTVREEVNRALHWYLFALDAADPFGEILALWTAVEALAPSESKPPVCHTCQVSLPPCVKCEKCVNVPAVGASIRKYLDSKLGVSAKVANELYRWRSKLVHGDRDRSFDEYAGAIRHAESTRTIVERLLSIELGLPDNSPVFITQPNHSAPIFDALVTFDQSEDALDLPVPLLAEVLQRLRGE